MLICSSKGNVFIKGSQNDLNKFFIILINYNFETYFK